MMRSGRTRRPLALGLLDVDHFKAVNDGYGHIAGDRVLRELATLIRGHLRHGDILGRLGGEELVAVLPGATREEARDRLDRIRERFGSIAHDGGNRGSFRVTFSAGVVDLRPDWTVELGLRRADRALYRAKSEGRDRVVLEQGLSQLLPEL